MWTGNRSSSRWWSTFTELLLRLLPILVAVKSCRGRAIDWQRRARGGVARKVVCLVSSSSCVRSRGPMAVDCAKSSRFPDGTSSSSSSAGGVGFNGKGGQFEDKLEQEADVQGAGRGFHAKTTYLGKVFCFVSVTLLLLYSSGWCCCYLMMRRISSSCSVPSDSSRTLQYGCTEVNTGAEEGPLAAQLWNAMNFGSISRDCHKEPKAEEVKELLQEDRPVVQAGTVALEVVPAARRALLGTSCVTMVSTTIILVILFCSHHHHNMQLMKEEQQEMKEKKGMGISIKGRMNLGMQTCQDFISKTKLQIFSGIAESWIGEGREEGEVVGGLTPNLQVLSDVDRFCRRSLLLANARV